MTQETPRDPALCGQSPIDPIRRSKTMKEQVA